MGNRLDCLLSTHDRWRLRQHHETRVIDARTVMLGVTVPQAFLKAPNPPVIHRRLLFPDQAISTTAIDRSRSRRSPFHLRSSLFVIRPAVRRREKAGIITLLYTRTMDKG